MSSFKQDPVTIGAKKIGLDDIFQFRCAACGNCCRGRNNIISGTSVYLSGPDIWRIMDYSKLTFDELLEKHIIVSLDPDLKINTCSLRFKYSGSCTFLKKGTCSIYEARPRTCALYPVGRTTLYTKTKRGIEFYGNEYLINGAEPDYECDFMSNDTYTVSEWITKNGVPINDVEDIEWFGKMSEYSDKANRRKLKDEELNQIFNILYQPHAYSVDK